MSFLRSVLALVLWALAIVAAIPAVMNVYPVVYETASVLRASPSVSVESALVDAFVKTENAALWLIFSALCVGNATLLHILSAVSRL